MVKLSKNEKSWSEKVTVWGLPIFLAIVCLGLSPLVFMKEQKPIVATKIHPLTLEIAESWEKNPNKWTIDTTLHFISISDSNNNNLDIHYSVSNEDDINKMILSCEYIRVYYNDEVIPVIYDYDQNIVASPDQLYLCEKLKKILLDIAQDRLNEKMKMVDKARVLVK